MKRLILFLIIVVNTTGISFSQIKILEATRQKLTGEIAGVYINYSIDLKSKSAETLIVDSVKTTVDSAAINFSFEAGEDRSYSVIFAQPIKKAEKCKTCPEEKIKYYDLSKGVILFCSSGKKKYQLKVKKFKQLPDAYRH